MKLPELYHIRQKVHTSCLQDVKKTLVERVAESRILDHVAPGAKVVVAVGSRGIPNYPEVVRHLVELLKDKGATVLILPAMGSHGGGHPSGQVRVLAELGITPKKVGAGIVTTMEMTLLGTTPNGIALWADKTLTECGHILLVNRIKPHTEFGGRIESGLLKMMAIGFGRRNGATEVHMRAVQLGYERTIREVARAYIERLPILAGIALLDSPEGKTADIRVVVPAVMESMEEELLSIVKEGSPRLPLRDIDVLIIDEMGKNVSGSGMDTKVIGRIMNIYEPEPESPRIARIFVRDLTPETSGNALGIGLADFTTQRLVAKIDTEATRINCITAVTPEKARIPIALPSDQEALRACLETIGPRDESSTRLVWIRNTTSLVDLFVSAAALAEIDPATVEVLEGPLAIEFDRDDNLVTLLRGAV